MYKATSNYVHLHLHAIEKFKQRRQQADKQFS